jgi:hypothetical protein
MRWVLVLFYVLSMEAIQSLPMAMANPNAETFPNLWKNARYGITVKEVQAAFPKSQDVVVPTLLDGVSCGVHPSDRRVAAAYGPLRADLQRRGLSFGSLDLMIAAHALSADATLVSNDKAFQRLDGLVVEDWLSGTL